MIELATKFAGQVQAGDTIVLEGSTIAVEGVYELQGVIHVSGVWTGVWGSERTTFPYAADYVVETR